MCTRKCILSFACQGISGSVSVLSVSVCGRYICIYARIYFTLRVKDDVWFSYEGHSHLHVLFCVFTVW